MYKVKIKFDKVEEPKAITVVGYTQKYPEEGVDFSIYLFKEDSKIYIDLGKIVHIKSYGDMLLVQTEYTVAEVWILENQEPTRAQIISIKPNTLMRIGDRIIGGRSKSSHKRKFDLKTLLDYGNLPSEPTVPPKFKLIQGELKC